MQKAPLNATLLLAAAFGLAYAQIPNPSAGTSGADDPAHFAPSWRSQMDAQLKELQRRVDVARAGGDTASPALAGDLNDLGSAYFDQAQLLDAERCFDEAIAIWTMPGSASPKIGFAFLNLAQLRIEQDRPSDGEKLFRRAGEILGPAFGAGSVELAAANIGLANALMHLHRTAEAETAARLALAALETRANTEHLGAALFLLAKAAWIQHRDDDAEALLRRAIEVWRAVLGSQHPTFASGLVCLAELLSEKRSSESGKLLRDALDVFESQLGSHHPYTGSTLLLYSRYLKSHGEKREAGKLRRRAEAIWAEYTRVNQLGHTLDVNTFQPTRTRHIP